MKQITRPFLRALREDIDNALAAVGEKHGVSIKAGSGSYTPTTATIKVQIGVIAEDGTVETREAGDFQRLAKLYGLEPTDLGREFVSGGQRFRITGLKARRQKYPIIAERDDGRAFKFPVETVRALLKQQGDAA